MHRSEILKRGTPWGAYTIHESAIINRVETLPITRGANGPVVGKATIVDDGTTVWAETRQPPVHELFAQVVTLHPKAAWMADPPPLGKLGPITLLSLFIIE